MSCGYQRPLHAVGVEFPGRHDLHHGHQVKTAHERHRNQVDVRHDEGVKLVPDTRAELGGR